MKNKSIIEEAGRRFGSDASAPGGKCVKGCSLCGIARRPGVLCVAGTCV